MPRKSYSDMNPKDDSLEELDSLSPKEKDELLDVAKKEGRKGNAAALTLWARLEGRLDKGNEGGFEFGPKEYIRVAREITEQLRADYKEHCRNCPVCGRPNLLLNEVCLSEEPEQRADRKMDAVALPDRPSDDIEF